MIVRPKCLSVQWSKTNSRTSKNFFRTKLELFSEALSSLWKKFLQFVLPIKWKTVWTIQRTSIKMFWAKLEHNYIAVILLWKKIRAMFSSYQVKTFGDYQLNFWADWEQKNTLVFFPKENIVHSFFSTGLKQFAANQPNIFEKMLELNF